jgi:HAD superfamily hydrolase (TIGR01509 family)
MMIQGVIFDMDGVLTDTQKFHSKVESEILGRFGINLSPEEITRRYAGVRTREFFDDLLKNTGIEYDLDKLMEEKWKRMEALASKSVEAIDGAIELVERLKRNGLRLAVASASNKSYVKTALAKLRIFHHFDFVVSGDMVRKGKPDPESFLLAAKNSGVEPPFALVIEDGISGMEAARAAGMKCVGLVSDTKANVPTQNRVTHLDEITDRYIENLI